MVNSKKCVQIQLINQEGPKIKCLTINNSALELVNKLITKYNYYNLNIGGHFMLN